MDRRTFLKFAGIGSLFVASGCSSEPEKNLFSQVQAPDDMVTGEASWYASTCRECPAGCGILAKNRDGRVVKLEGNPLHPINKGKLCMRGQAALQGLYHPDRIRTPLLKEESGLRAISFSRAESIIREKAIGAAMRGPNRVCMLTEMGGESLIGLFTESLRRWRSGGPLVYEPFGYEFLKMANQIVFGISGLISYRIEEADLLVSFGADFLETWLSPVAYARKFNAMHSLREGRKGRFLHISPYQSLTCANADLWLSCNPGSEAIIALGLIREILQRGRGKDLPEGILKILKKSLTPHTKERVLRQSGLSEDHYEKLLNLLLKARRPLVLGLGSVTPGINALQGEIAVNLLNLLLDPELSLFDFRNRHRVEKAARKSEVLDFLKHLEKATVELLLLNNVNPVFTLPSGEQIKEVIERDDLFVVSFSNFMDETTRHADLILPVRLPLENWDEYGGIQGSVSILQPAMGSITGAPQMGDLFIRITSDTEKPSKDFRTYIYSQLLEAGRIKNEKDWMLAIQRGGIFDDSSKVETAPSWAPSEDFASYLKHLAPPVTSELYFIATPSIRFFDGRGANRSWLCEVPDSLSQVSWQTPILVHPDSLKQHDLREGDIINITSKWGRLEAPVYETTGVRPGILVMGIGQGHNAYGRYAEGMGVNPIGIFSSETEPVSGGPRFFPASITIEKTGRSVKLACVAGSKTQHGRKIALSVDLKDLIHSRGHKTHGLSMDDFPLTLPLPEGYEHTRDIYPPHEHEEYRWAMVVDLDKCIGCSACTVACYAENNLGVVGLDRVIEGREMSWLAVQRYHDPEQMEKVTFLPMLCQHCENAPCESVCPVYASHHSKEGLNNQIYNRCIGTRFCSQNCPYKVRRFNWYSWKWPKPLHLQLNPDVTVRSKGVMEKCSFCIQRIKEAHGKAKNEKRKIMDGEIQPACLQTCPTGVFTFGNIMDPKSKVRRLFEDERTYQVMGYLNTKPAVIYLKKVVQEI